MRFFEYEAKDIFKGTGINVPAGYLAVNEKEIEKAAAMLTPPYVIKCQILAGGRMKSGGVKFAREIKEAVRLGRSLLNKKIKGFKVEKIIIEEKISFEKELFVGITYDTAAKEPLLLVSTSGGIDVEEKSGGQFIRRVLSFSRGLSQEEAQEIISPLNLKRENTKILTALICRVFKLFYDLDATLIEINPLVECRGDFFALDGHIEIDDDALYRHPELNSIERGQSLSRPQTEFEKKAAAIDAQDYRGVAGRLVEFDGDLGLLIGGGGASLTVFDAILANGGQPANYCEIGGSPTVRKISELTRLLLSKPGVKKIAVIMNVVNNTRSDLIARGIIKGIAASGKNPKDVIAAFRVPGSWEEESWKILNAYGVTYFDRNTSISKAARFAIDNGN